MCIMSIWCLRDIYLIIIIDYNTTQCLWVDMAVWRFLLYFLYKYHIFAVCWLKSFACQMEILISNMFLFCPLCCIVLYDVWSLLLKYFFQQFSFLLKESSYKQHILFHFGIKMIVWVITDWFPFICCNMCCGVLLKFRLHKKFLSSHRFIFALLVYADRKDGICIAWWPFRYAIEW